MKIDRKETCGKVWLVGAGPGDIGLLAQKAQNVLEEAEVIVYDALVSLEILAALPGEAELIDVGKRAGNHLASQEEINEILCLKAKEGKKVVRLKGGDPFVFGRGGEELELLAKEGIPFEVIPGITSAVAVPAYNGIPVTHRDYTSSFHVITGHKKKDGVLDVDFASLAKLQATLVFLMGVSEMETICERLMENGMDRKTPAAILERGTTAGQKRAVGTLSTLKAAAEKRGIKSPAVIVVGRVCELEKEFAWMEKKPLFGKQILVTRPHQGQSALAQKLRSLGAQVLSFPTIKIAPRWDYRHAIEEMLQEKEPVCITFTSPRGVENFFEELLREKIDLRRIAGKRELSFAVLGAGTGKALEQKGIFADYMPEKYSAISLAKLLVKEWKRDGWIYLYRAARGSKELIKILESHRMKVRDIPIYDTLYQRDHPITEKIRIALTEGEIDAVMFTSASTVQGFAQCFPDLDYKKVHAVCIGEQTAAEAYKYDMDVMISKEATLEGMISVLAEQ